MALVTQSSNVSMDAASGGLAPHLSDGLVAGEALLAGAPCYVKSDGAVWMSNGTAANAAAAIHGFTPKAYAVGQAVSLFGKGAKFEYASGMTPGQYLYLGTTAGRLDTAATTGGTTPCAFAYDATHIMVL
jgi:hypothetical protein